MDSPMVLAVTKRIRELCGTQGMLYAAGCSMMTATNKTTARSVLKAVEVDGVIVCRSSWSEQERDSICSEVETLQSEVSIMRCPGCSGCDEATGTPGTLSNISPLVELIAAMKDRST
jgi:hypothetical protein